ncbi:MAG TPA: DUF2795 domain-containing protein [Rubrobacter sp.]|nr:DUF2795 domain-containing protein [Rubrobacter sp.]
MLKELSVRILRSLRYPPQKAVEYSERLVRGERGPRKDPMTFNPLAVDLHKYLEGADYPASGEELTFTARSNAPPDVLTEALRGLGDEEFSGPGEVSAALLRQVARRERAQLRSLRRPE